MMDRSLDKGIVGLPVHDSLVVQDSHESRVREIMHDELCKTLSGLRQGVNFCREY